MILFSNNCDNIPEVASRLLVCPCLLAPRLGPFVSLSHLPPWSVLTTLH